MGYRYDIYRMSYPSSIKLEPHLAEINAPVARPPAVLLVDDHALFRTALRNLIETEGMRVVGDCCGNDSALEMARRTRASVVIIDINNTSGEADMRLITRFKDELPSVGVLILTRSNNPLDIFQAIRAGAIGYVEKKADIEEICRAINAVHEGLAFLEPATLNTVLGFIRTGNTPYKSHPTLSERELEILCLITEGLDNNEIAERTNISAKTVKNHVSSILTKLDLSNRVQAAVYAVNSGITQPS